MKLWPILCFVEGDRNVLGLTYKGYQQRLIKTLFIEHFRSLSLNSNPRSASKPHFSASLQTCLCIQLCNSHT